MSDEQEKERDTSSKPGTEQAQPGGETRVVEESAGGDSGTPAGEALTPPAEQAQPGGDTPLVEGSAASDAATPAGVAATTPAEQAQPEGVAPAEQAPAVDPEREAKLKAAAEARAARAAAKAAAGDAPAPATGGEVAAPAEPKPPSPNQPQLDLAAELIRSQIADDAIEEAYINELDGHLPTLLLRGEHLLAVAKLLKTHPRLQMNYLRNLSGVDYETHLEVVYHLVSLPTGQEIAFKVKTDREAPAVPSLVSVWETANWNEREVYDLLGVDFPGHPDLRRIMMPDSWVGHPLRKDYEPLDSEV